MFPVRYFAPRYFPKAYFPEVGGAIVVPGFVVHYKDVLIPNGSLFLSHYAAATGVMSDTVLWSSLIQDPVAFGTYATGVIDTQYDSSLRVFSEIATQLLPGQSGAAAVIDFLIDTWLTGQPDPGTFNLWTSGYVSMRYLRGMISYQPSAGNVSLISSFIPHIDVAPASTTGDNVTIAPGGTVVTFPVKFHTPPFVVATPQGNTALYATVVNITSTQCEIHVWNNSGTDVGGVVNYTATGE